MQGTGDIFIGQFMLSQKEKLVPHEFVSYQLKSWFLCVHKSLAVMNVYNQDNLDVGWVVGILIDNENEKIIENKLVVPVTDNMSIEVKARKIDDYIYRFGGRYVLIYLDKEFQCVYLDAAGSLSCVYSLTEQTLASTPGLILDKRMYYTDLNEELYQALGMPRDGWYPSGLTAHTSIRRLLPNHYFDLRSWKSVRHWPHQMIAVRDVPMIATKEITSIVKSTIKAISRKTAVYITLTAGRDSRTLLACSKESLERIKCITFVEQKETVDEHIARLLVDRFGLNAEFLPITIATEEQKSRWLYEVGHCVSGRILEIHPTLEKLEKTRIILPGLSLEARGFYFRHLDRENTEISSENLLKRLKLPLHKYLLAATDNWLSEPKFLNTFQMLELVYIEQRLGCWGGPQTYGQIRFLNHLYPLLHRSIFERILSFPPEYKKTGWRVDSKPKKDSYISDSIISQWPDLMDYPINEFSGVKNLISKIRRIRRLPSVFSVNN